MRNAHTHTHTSSMHLEIIFESDEKIRPRRKRRRRSRDGCNSALFFSIYPFLCDILLISFLFCEKEEEEEEEGEEKKSRRFLFSFSHTRRSWTNRVEIFNISASARVPYRVWTACVLTPRQTTDEEENEEEEEKTMMTTLPNRPSIEGDDLLILLSPSATQPIDRSVGLKFQFGTKRSENVFLLPRLSEPKAKFSRKSSDESHFYRRMTSATFWENEGRDKIIKQVVCNTALLLSLSLSCFFFFFVVFFAQTSFLSFE